jgi:hypothetical protein
MNFREWLASKIAPEMYTKSLMYDDLFRSAKEISKFLQNEIPEAYMALDWVAGHTWINFNKNLDMLNPHITYIKYPSLVNFIEILKAEYKRKTR